MTTHYTTHAELQLRDDLPEAEMVFGRTLATADGTPAETLGYSADVHLPSTNALRSLRTIAPIVLSDMLALSLSGCIAQLLMMVVLPEAAALVGWAAPLALLPMVLAYWLNDLYVEIWLHPVIELRQMTHLTTVGMISAMAAGMLIWPLPLWCLAAFLPATALVPLGRVVTRHIFGRFQWWGYPALIIGSGEDAEDLARSLAATPFSSLRPAVLTDPLGICRTSWLPVVNDPLTLQSIIRARGIRHAVLSLPSLPVTELGALIDNYGGLIPHMLVLSDTSTFPALWGATRNCGRISGLEIRNQLLQRTLLLVKRGIDLFVASTALVLAAPLMVIIAILIKLDSPGPIFFGHRRLGQRGQMFTTWKFRSMRVDGDRILAETLEKDPEARREWAETQKLRNDPRITPLGKFLRRTSLDELPQLWNVLRGDMSIVGPRPIVQGEVCRYGDSIRLYSTVKPGLTGLWQVSGRTETSYADRVRFDEFYIRHWSPWLDIYILAKTVVTLLKRQGAY
mgnify:CR=1 FL=1